MQDFIKGLRGRRESVFFKQKMQFTMITTRFRLFLYPILYVICILAFSTETRVYTYYQSDNGKMKKERWYKWRFLHDFCFLSDSSDDRTKDKYIASSISYMYLFKSGTASQLGDVAHGHLILVYVFYGSFCYACISRCIEF